MIRNKFLLNRIEALDDMLKIFVDELKTVFKDEGVIIFFFVVPILYPLLYSWIYTNEVVSNVPAIMVDASHTSLSRELTRKLDATRDVHIVGYANSIEEAKEAIRQQSARGIFYIPSTFSSDIQNGKQTSVSIYVDMSGILYYKALLISLTDVTLAMGADIQIQKLGNYTEREDQLSTAPLEFEAISMFNPAGGYGSYLIPGVLMLIIQQTLLLGIGLSAGTQREKNRYKTLVPIEKHYHGMYRIVFGKGLCYFLIYAIMSTYITIGVPHIFHFIQIAHTRDIMMLLLPYILACIFFGMTVSCLIRYREYIILVIVFTSVPLLFLSGILWPTSAMSGTWKAISWLFPSTFGVNGYVKMNSLGATIEDINVEYFMLWVQAGIYFLLACLVYYRQIERSKKSSSIIPEK